MVPHTPDIGRLRTLVSSRADNIGASRHPNPHRETSTPHPPGSLRSSQGVSSARGAEESLRDGPLDSQQIPVSSGRPGSGAPLAEETPDAQHAPTARSAQFIPRPQRHDPKKARQLSTPSAAPPPAPEPDGYRGS